MRDGSRLVPLSQDGARSTEIHDSNGQVPDTSAAPVLVPVGTPVQVAIPHCIYQTTNTSSDRRARSQQSADRPGTLTPRSRSETNRSLFSTQIPSPSLDHATSPVTNSSPDLDHVLADLQTASAGGSENSGTLPPTPRMDFPPPPSYQEVIEGGYPELPPTCQQTVLYSGQHGSDN